MHAVLDKRGPGHKYVIPEQGEQPFSPALLFPGPTFGGMPKCPSGRAWLRLRTTLAPSKGNMPPLSQRAHHAARAATGSQGVQSERAMVMVR